MHRRGTAVYFSVLAFSIIIVAGGSCLLPPCVSPALGRALFVQLIHLYLMVVQRQRSNTHDAAAALAAADRGATLQRRQAGIPRRAAAVKLRHVAEPGKGFSAILFTLFKSHFLCPQPVRIGGRKICRQACAGIYSAFP